MQFLNCLKALLYGILEGITEWLPISSTGHLILLEELLPFQFPIDGVFADAFFEMFEVVIQLGAVCAVVILYREKLFSFLLGKSRTERQAGRSLWIKVIVGCIPAAFAGVFLDGLLERLTGKDIDGWLYHSGVVAVALIVYGIAFLLIGRFRKNKMPTAERTEQVTLPTAAKIGCFQALSLIPGTSRSGSTILGGMLLGLSGSAAAEFSFFMSVPIMAGASGVKIVRFAAFVSENSVTVPGNALAVLFIGCISAFAVSVAVIRFFMDFVKRHGFVPFGIYRIVLGSLVLLFGMVK